MADKSEAIFTSVSGKTKRILEANDNALLALSIFATTQAKALAPVDQGQLRNSIQYRVGDGQTGGFNDGSGLTAGERLSVSPKRGDAAIGATANYSVYQEYGTRNTQPQPFLRPSLALTAGEAPKIVTRKMNEEVDKWKAYFKKEKL